MTDDAVIRDKLSEELTKILAEIPGQLDIVGAVRNAHARLITVASAPETMIADCIVEVLREIAAQAVGEFERRTGQQFLWVDEPEEPPETIMSFGVAVKDGKGIVTF